MAEKDTKVTAAALHRAMGERCASALREVYPRDAAKLLSRDFGWAQATAKKYLAGALPSGANLAVMLQRFGPRFAAYVLEPCGDWTAGLRLQAELDALEERAAALSTEIASIRAQVRRG